MTQTIKMEHWFGSEGCNIQDSVQDGRHFKANFNLNSKSQLITLF